MNNQEKQIGERIKQYMQLPYKIDVFPDTEEGGFAVMCPELPGCMTSVSKWEDAYPAIEDAKRCWLWAAMEEGQEIPVPQPLETYSGQFKLRVPKTLHRNLAEKAKEQGVSMNQYCVYALSRCV